ncbi:DUF2812 domain-containing protein [Alkalicoccobacillus porphyridii]|uniref:DUF2812 domain-containing protein n=1 Tax=Alkalicoccobacillus porphyridii TaxID=2597270 RepID=A0A553ZVJ9_9BACI|nr:DUF2812 domain-containing protein [Alkalicoccobacillus porphyridii]TSB45336.1 DUF2812 domain-containing protein [Alkalicoccobacillus porphyridii]
MRRFKFFLDFSKEEQWLNKMAQKGNHLMYHSFGYRFEKGESKDTIYKIDYRHFKSKQDFSDYEILFADSGWLRLPCPRRNGHQYFKRVSEDASYDIFSDHDSKAARYKRMADVFLPQFMIFMPAIVVFYMTGIFNNYSLNPIEWYLTPGLWDMTGVRFLASFLFETPFALMRGGLVYLFVLSGALSGYCWWKAHQLYKKEAQL